MSWTRLFRGSGGRAPTARQRPLFRVELLEDRSVPATFPFTPNAFGGGNFNPFPGFTGQVQTASGDVNGDGTPDIIAAQGVGPGSASRVTIFDGASLRQSSQVVPIADFFAYSDTPGASQTPGFGGGVFVASADLNKDGFAEVVTSTGAGGDGHTKVFDFRDPGSGAFLGSNPILRTSFFAFPGYLGDVRVAALQRGAGLPPVLVVASGAGTTDTDIRAYADPFSIGSAAPGQFIQPLARTVAFPGYLGGTSIAAADINGDGVSELFVTTNVGPPTLASFGLGAGGAGFTPGPEFQLAATPQSDFRLGVADLNGDGIDDILTSPFGSAGGGLVSALALSGNRLVRLPDTLAGFQGFGFFNGAWLASGTFLTLPAPTVTPIGIAPTPVGDSIIDDPILGAPIFDGPIFGGSGFGISTPPDTEINTGINSGLNTGVNIGNTLTGVTPVQTVNTSPASTNLAGGIV